MYLDQPIGNKAKGLIKKNTHFNKTDLYDREFDKNSTVIV